MSDLIEFLLARIAEDEAAASYANSRDGKLSDHDTAGWWLGHYQHYTRHDPARVLSECEAKRRIVEDHPRCDVHDRPGRECDACQTCGDGSIWPCLTLLHLAAIYADHPDYREEWAP